MTSLFRFDDDELIIHNWPNKWNLVDARDELVMNNLMFPAYSVEAQAPGVHGYALILLITVVEVK